MSKEVVLFGRGDQDDYSGPLRPLKVDADTHTLHILNWVYNPSTLAWERMKQPVLELTGDLTVTMGDVERLLAGQYWKDHRIERDGNNLPLYIGVHTTHKASVDDADDPGWWIVKFTRTGYLLDRVEGPLQGAWSNRASLAWA